MARKGRAKDPCNTTIEGYFGQFSISAHDDIASSPVYFIETVLSVETDDSNQQDFLKNLEVFREVFDIEELDFSEIMQRDIDDNRVSTELIPYLLGLGNYELNFSPQFNGLQDFSPNSWNSGPR